MVGYWEKLRILPQIILQQVFCFRIDHYLKPSVKVGNVTIGRTLNLRYVIQLKGDP